MHATGHTSTQAPSLVHRVVMTYGTAATGRAALRRDEGQVGTNHAGPVNPGAVLRGHQSPGAIEGAQLRRRRQSRTADRARPARAVSQLTHPRAQPDGADQSALPRYT